MNTTTTTLPDDTFAAHWRDWHSAREDELSQPLGWLSLTALHWLVREPSAYPDLPGKWWFDAHGVWFEPGDEPVKLDGAVLTSRAKVAAADGTTDGILTTGQRQLEIVARGEGNRGVRVRDPLARTLLEFTGVPAYTPDPAWRITARFTPLPETRRVTVDSAAAGVQAVTRIIGHASFTRDGQEHRLAVSSGHRTSIVFRDATSGTETFGLLRQLPVQPSDDGTVELDFNRAINPPCSFTPYGTCPFPPPGNVLPFAVTAGEKAPIGH